MATSSFPAFFMYKKFLFLNNNYWVISMKNDKDLNDNKDKKLKEDTTKYGEFVPSSYHWIPVEKLKDRAEELSNITKKNKKD